MKKRHVGGEKHKLFDRGIDVFDSMAYDIRQVGGLSVVEKVKPDPLNLLANTNVGKLSIQDKIVFDKGVSCQGNALFDSVGNVVSYRIKKGCRGENPPRRRQHRFIRFCGQ